MLAVIAFAILINLVFAWFCAVQAENRGHDQLTWGVLGFIFGVFALCVLLLLPPGEPHGGWDPDKPAPPHPSELPKSRRLICPDCGAVAPMVELVNGDRIYCANEDRITGVYAGPST